MSMAYRVYLSRNELRVSAMHAVRSIEVHVNDARSGTPFLGNVCICI